MPGKFDPESVTQFRLTTAGLLLLGCYDDNKAPGPGPERVTVVSQRSREKLTHCFLNNTFHDTVQSLFTFLCAYDRAGRKPQSRNPKLNYHKSEERQVSLLGEIKIKAHNAAI